MKEKKSRRFYPAAKGTKITDWSFMKEQKTDSRGNLSAV
jgi:hypothetical protein